jgi:signal transduction histidine kinase
MEGMNLLARMETEDIQEYLMHELNTPLTVIKGYVEMLQDKNIDNPEITKYLNAIWKNAERIEKIPLNVAEKFKGDRNTPFSSD